MVPTLPPNVEVRRSVRRRRTVSAYRDGDRTIVLIPARFSQAEEERWVHDMLERLRIRDQRRERGPRRSDQALLRRAKQLSEQYLANRAEPHEARWVSNMTSRWGSCTPVDRTIRISDRLRDVPTWVLDYVIMHEIAHLIAPGHDRHFWDLVEQYPRTERARGYLEGLAAAARIPISPNEEEEESTT